MTRRLFLHFALVFALGVVAGHLIHGQLTGAPGPLTANEPAPEPAPLPDDLTDEETRNIEIFRRASASVVYLTSIVRYRSFFFDETQIQGSGTGFFWGRDGHVVTNYHVIEDANRFAVTMADHTSYEAQVVGIAPEKDLVVLKIRAP